MLLFLVALPLAAPAALVAFALAAAAHNYAPAVAASSVLAVVELLQFAVAGAFARGKGGAQAMHLWPSLFAARLVYRPILWWIALRSIMRLADGVPLGWGKLARRNTAVAYAVATAPARAASG
jgi:hypothetical protein